MGLPIRRRPTGLAERDPIEEFDRMREDLWSLLDTPWAPFESWPARLGESHIALAGLEETDDAYTLEVELPGIDTADGDVEIEGRRVIVTAERKEREREGILRRRTRVTMDQGVLHLRLPKTETTKRRRIEIH
jgi:HSP20 family protein